MRSPATLSLAPVSRAVALTAAAAAALAGCEAQPERADSQAFECRVDPQDLGSAHPRHADYADALEREARAQGLPGAVLLIRDEHGLWAGAYGTADALVGAPMRPCQPTRIASVTKTMTATAVMQLAEVGAVALDDRYATHVGSTWTTGLPNAQTATIRDLLANESGIPNYIDAAFVIEVLNHPWRRWTEAEAIQRVAGRPADFPAGQGFAYSNTGYILAGKVVEGASGRTLAEQFEADIFAPLAMDSTRYVPDAPDLDGVARGYFDLFGTGELVDSTQTFADTVTGAEGGVISTAYDLRRFLDALYRDGALVSGPLLAEMTALRPTSRSDAWLLPAFYGYGLGTLGWETPGGARGLGHSGDEFGYAAAAYYFPAHDRTFVLLVNGSSLQPRADNLSARFERARDALVEVALD